MKKSTVLAAAMAMSLAFHAHATDYYWIGGESSEWANSSNWSLAEGGEAASEYPNGYEDTAFFPSGATLTLNSYAKVRKIFTDGTLTLAGNGNGGIQTADNNNAAPLTIGGSGLIRLAGVTIYVPYGTSDDGSQTQITNDLEIVAGTTNVLRIATGNTRYASAYLYGALTGSGTLIASSNIDSKNYKVYLYCDASDFRGVFADHLPGDENATRIYVMDESALGQYAAYDLAATYSGGGMNYVLRAGGTGTTYQMGALNGEVHFDGNNNGKADQKFGYTLEIGGRNEPCSFGGTIARGGYASYTKKVGTADMTFTGSQMPNLTIENGTYIVGTSTALPGEMIFTGGAFSVAEGVSVNPPAKFSASSTAAVVFDDRGLQNSWSSALTDARVPYGFTKKGAGTLTLTTAPTHTTLTTIEDGTLVVPQGTVIAELACAGGKLTVPFTGTENETAVLTISALADGTTAEDLEKAVSVAGVAISVESGESGYVVKATRKAQTFTWTGAADTAWEDGANWTVDGVVASTAPIAIDTVTFPSALGDKTNVVLSARATVAEVIADSDVALSGAQICSPVYRGDGKLVLGDGAGFYVNAETVVSNALEIVGDVAVTPSADSKIVRFFGDITGSGTLTIGGNRTTCELACDNSGFSGSIVAEKDSVDRKNIYLSSETAASENARWTVHSSGGGNDGFLHFKDKTVKFGSLNGNLYFGQMDYARNVLEVGVLGDDMEISGKFCYADGDNRISGSGNDIRKVGAGNLTLTAKWVRNTIMQEGLVTLADGTNSVHSEVRYTFTGGAMAITGKNDLGGDVDFADVSALIVNSTSPICFSNGVNEVHTWASELSSSNVGGLTKLGAGTLTLSKKPLYTGLTTVEAGKLEVPTGTELSYNAFSDTNLVSGATITNYAYAANTTLVAPATSGSVTYDKPLDISNVKAIDASGVTLTKGQPYVIASATAVTGYTKASLAEITLTLPASADATKWVVKVLDVDGKRALCVAPKAMPFAIIVR